MFDEGLTPLQVLYSELQSFDEVLAVGTAVSVASVGSITRRATGDELIYSSDEKPGNCAVFLLKKLQEIQLGMAEDTFAWLTQVGEEALDICTAE